eukprot:g96.t1
MQNDELVFMRGRRRTVQPSELLGMEDYLNMPFDQLWGHSQSQTTNVMPPVTQMQRRATRTFLHPHIDFGAIHALQGTSRPAPSSFGTFDLDPHNLGRVQRGVRPEVLQRLGSGVTIQDTEEESVCHICMDAFKPGIRKKELPCKHMFCCSCITEWLKDNDTCPVCRYKFPEHQTYLKNLHN